MLYRPRTARRAVLAAALIATAAACDAPPDTPRRADAPPDAPVVPDAAPPDADDAAATTPCRAAPAAADATDVATDRGTVRGRVEGAARVFRGIPYAAPPTGALRFRPPVPAACWN